MDLEELLKIIVCPKCKRQLAAISNGLACQACQLVYPIRDNIPILLLEEAVPQSEWGEKKCEC